MLFIQQLLIRLFRGEGSRKENYELLKYPFCTIESWFNNSSDLEVTAGNWSDISKYRGWEHYFCIFYKDPVISKIYRILKFTKLFPAVLQNAALSEFPHIGLCLHMLLGREEGAEECTSQPFLSVLSLNINAS